MSNIIDLDRERQVRLVNQSLQDVKEGRWKPTITPKGRTQGKTDPTMIIQVMSYYMKHDKVPVEFTPGGHTWSREAYLEGRGDRLELVETAKVIPFRRKQ